MLELEFAQEPAELSDIEVEEQLARLAELNAEIEAAQKRRDEFQSLYRQKILKADEIFQTDTFEARAEIDSLMIGLKRFAETHITGRRKSIKFPSGTLCFKKRQPQFFIDGKPVANDNPRLIQIAKSLDGDLIQTTETAKWYEMKRRLTVDEDGNVIVTETGEVLTDMRALNFPDDFTVKTT